MTSTTKQMRPNGRGCKYWQLNQSNEHASNYSRIKQRQRMRRYTMKIYTQKTRINGQNRLKITFPGSVNPKEISQQCTPATHTEAVHCQRVLLGSSILTTDHRRLPDAPWGEGRQTSRQPTDASTHHHSICQGFLQWGWRFLTGWMLFLMSN